MIKSKTVFIVGAGASAEVGLPVGNALKQTIGIKMDIKYGDFGEKLLSGDRDIATYMRRTFGNLVNQYLHACWTISDGINLAGSIDDFIDTHQDNPDVAVCGKIAIAHSILEAERQSKLYFEQRNRDSIFNVGALAKTWYAPFIELLSQELPRTEVEAIFDKVTIICFNYDRCIEHFLLHALKRRYAISEEKALEVLATLNIIHPYGVVGPYAPLHRKGIAFGLENPPPLESIISNLRTYTEEVADTTALKVTKDAIAEAEVVVFLGTAFHPNNMKLMAAGAGETASKRVYATVEGISNENRQVVDMDIRTLFYGSKVDIGFAGTCSDLFSRYSMHLRR